MTGPTKKAGAGKSDRDRAGHETARTGQPLERGGDSVDFINRPGPGETRDGAEKPAARLDLESQSGGRSVQEELVIQPNEDDAGALPNQAVANRGRLPQTKGRDVTEEHYPLPES